MPVLIASIFLIVLYGRDTWVLQIPETVAIRR